MPTQVSKRLQYLSGFGLDREYDHYYDLCCDHGLLGMKLAQIHKDSQVHFVDCQKHIIDQLAKQLKCEEFHNYTITQQDIRDLNIQPKSLVVIAGVGGILISEFFKKQYIDSKDVDYLVCCNQQVTKMREQLRELNVRSFREELIYCQKHHYEVLYLGKRALNKVPVFFNDYDFLNREHLNHVEKQIELYQLKSIHAGGQEYKDILEHFNSLKRKFICTH